MQYGKVPDDGDTKWTNVWLRIRPVIRQLTLQAKAVQTPEELCQAAPNPSPLGTLHLFFPPPFSPFYLEEMKVLSFSRTVNQLIMQVHKPKVEYKLALQERPKGENLDVLL